MTHPLNPPSSEALESLRSMLIESLDTSPESKILGAQLGAKLNDLLSPDSYKSWLNEGSQNLRSFAEAFLQGIVTPTQERQGQDYLFRIEGNPQQIVHSFGGALWKAFCSVRPNQTIRFDHNRGSLFLAPAGTEDAIEGELLSQISEHEHKAICMEFAELLERDGRASPQLIETAKTFEHRLNSVWVATLKSEPGLFKEWGIFRVSRIKDLFSQRLQALTEDKATRSRLKSEFDADYGSQLRARSGSATSQVLSAIASSVSPRTSDQAARQVLFKALEVLDDTQLAKILVPMDLVIALLVQRKP